MGRPAGHPNFALDRKVEAVTTALAVGDVKASEQLGISRRLITLWRSDRRVLDAIPDRAMDAYVGRLQGIHDLALERVEEGLRDPKTPLRDSTTAYRELANSLRLARGEVPKRSETITFDVRAQSERLAADLGLDPELVYAEANAIMEGRPLPPVNVTPLPAPSPQEEHDRAMADLLGPGEEV